MGEGAYLAVARLRKPHGLKGESVVWVLTDDPETVLAPGRRLTPIDEEGRPIGEALVIERSRPYHRQWLLRFVGVEERGPIEAWSQRLFGVAPDELTPPGDGELYVHEVPGARVTVGDREVGVARDLIDTPGGPLLSVDVGGREVLVPFRRPIVRDVRRAERCIVLDPPPGLLDL